MASTCNRAAERRGDSDTQATAVLPKTSCLAMGPPLPALNRCRLPAAFLRAVVTMIESSRVVSVKTIALNPRVAGCLALALQPAQGGRAGSAKPLPPAAVLIEHDFDNQRQGLYHASKLRVVLHHTLANVLPAQALPLPA